MPNYYWSAIEKDTGEIAESATKYGSEKEARKSAHSFISNNKYWKHYSIKVTNEPYPYSSNAIPE